MEIGDIVVRKSYGKDITFKIIDIKEDEAQKTYILKGINIRIIADSTEGDLEEVTKEYSGEKDRIFNSRVNEVIKKVMASRIDIKRIQKSPKIIPTKELAFGRPGKILHIDGDENYLEACLKAYKQLSLDAAGYVVAEREQPLKAVEFVKQIKPDIIVLTGHDGMVRDTKDFLDLSNYRNSKYFIEAVTALRNYNSSYDELVIFAGACQSCYERILDAGANFASSPSRVLIHCLDPVFICEKIAYTN
ncbi:sporulation peptidase YabG, partial [Clostridium polynesiense]|uniref:sporulation peptidase YabG n=1 Tax=Clostridium polynesiense TaxID=1325933 RepID=UPI00058CF68C